MDLLANLPYTTFAAFYIRVKRIKHGWMNLHIGVNDKYLEYSASYLCDPLNDLLDVAVRIIKEQEVNNVHHADNFYVIHNLESDLVTWLFKYINNELMLIIWKGIPANFEELIDADFNSQNIEIQLLNEVPELTKELSFALKGSFVLYIKSLIDTFQKLDVLKRWDDDSDDSNWGFSYPMDKLNVLKEWLLKNELQII